MNPGSHPTTRSRSTGSCVKADMRRRCSSLALNSALALGAGLLLFVANSKAAEGTPIPHGTLELVAENQSIAAGHTIHLGLHFQLEKGWRIYWVNPGDSGEPPRLKWRLPPGASVGEVAWPTPRRLGTSTIVDFGYEDDVMLIVPMHAAASMATQGLAQVGAEVKVLVCREMCIPGKAQVSLTLPVKSQAPVPDARNADLFATARKALPRAAPASWRISVTEAKDSFLLSANLGRNVPHVEFFPAAESQIQDAAPQQFIAMAGGFRLTLRKSDQLLKPIERLKGVLVLAGDRGYVIDVPVTKVVAVRRDVGDGINLADSLKEVMLK
jgi:DsbC/DsbD-like thiol-disulfide interchange protein